jgi:hypothetical protein
MAETYTQVNSFYSKLTDLKSTLYCATAIVAYETKLHFIRLSNITLEHLG